MFRRIPRTPARRALGLAWRLRTAAPSSGSLAETMCEAADLLENPYPVVDDVEELDALVLSTETPVDVVRLLDTYGNVHTAHPDREAERVVIVRQATLAEARAYDDGDEPSELRAPMARPSWELEHSRFPMRVLHTVPAWHVTHPPVALPA